MGSFRESEGKGIPSGNLEKKILNYARNYPNVAFRHAKYLCLLHHCISVPSFVCLFVLSFSPCPMLFFGYKCADTS